MISTLDPDFASIPLPTLLPPFHQSNLVPSTLETMAEKRQTVSYITSLPANSKGVERKVLFMSKQHNNHDISACPKFCLTPFANLASSPALDYPYAPYNKDYDRVDQTSSSITPLL